MKVSVIIPYFEREDHLQQTLEAITKQTMNLDEYEIIVVDDGSDRFVEPSIALKIRWIRTPHRGAAAARNTGIFAARGETIIFLDSDIIVPSSFVQSHSNFHQEQDQKIALGFRLHQDESGQVQEVDTRFKLLKRYGMNGSTLQHPWFMAYTCNISLKKDTALKELFDEKYISWGLEDCEWAYRLFLRKFTFEFIERATAIHLYHDRTMTDEKFQGWKHNLAYTVSKHPELSILNCFQDVFDPLKKTDYFQAYDLFEDKICVYS